MIQNHSDGGMTGCVVVVKVWIGEATTKYVACPRFSKPFIQ
jgi:hypothetical protein